MKKLVLAILRSDVTIAILIVIIVILSSVLSEKYLKKIESINLVKLEYADGYNKMNLAIEKIKEVTNFIDKKEEQEAITNIKPDSNEYNKKENQLSSEQMMAMVKKSYNTLLENKYWRIRGEMVSVIKMNMEHKVLDFNNARYNKIINQVNSIPDSTISSYTQNGVFTQFSTEVSQKKNDKLISLPLMLYGGKRFISFIFVKPTNGVDIGYGEFLECKFPIVVFNKEHRNSKYNKYRQDIAFQVYSQDSSINGESVPNIQVRVQYGIDYANKIPDNILATGSHDGKFKNVIVSKLTNGKFIFTYNNDNE